MLIANPRILRPDFPQADENLEGLKKAEFESMRHTVEKGIESGTGRQKSSWLSSSIYFDLIDKLDVAIEQRSCCRQATEWRRAIEGQIHDAQAGRQVRTE